MRGIYSTYTYIIKEKNRLLLCKCMSIDAFARAYTRTWVILLAKEA